MNWKISTEFLLHKFSLTRQETGSARDYNLIELVEDNSGKLVENLNRAVAIVTFCIGRPVINNTKWGIYLL